MHTIDINVSGDSSVFEIDDFHLNTSLNIHNDPSNPASIIFLKLPESQDVVEFFGAIKAGGAESDLVILVNNDTHIHNGDLRDFSHVLISDHPILKQTHNNIILDSDRHHGSKLIIDNFRAHEGYIFCDELDLLKGGKVTDILGINSGGKVNKINIQGLGNGYFVIGKLDIRSYLSELVLNGVMINNDFEHIGVDNCTLTRSITRGNISLKSIENFEQLALTSAAELHNIETNSIVINNLRYHVGKFYISAKSYINFNIAEGGVLQGIDLFLDMTSGSEAGKKVIFPAHKFHFKHITIKGADDVSILHGGSCRELSLIDCAKVSVHKIIANDIKYSINMVKLTFRELMLQNF